MLTDGDGAEGAAAALSRLPAARIESMAQHLRHPDAVVRRTVVELLGRSRHSQATTLVVEALADSSALVREAATLALARRRHVV
jgi:HEAT repeat protein